MIKYVIGDATNPIGEGKKLIIHVCNDKNRWGLGFVLALSKKWKAPEMAYRHNSWKLGDIQFVDVEEDITVVNMIAQHDVKPTFITYPNAIVPIPPIRYDAVKECLKAVNEYAKALNATIHAPRFGAGLSGGDWNKIEALIKETITVDVTIYDLK